LAQTPGGRLAGIVVDQSGAGVPGATIVVTSSDFRTVTASGSGGAFSIGGLLPGTYDVTVTLEGFAQQTRSDIMVGNAVVNLPPIAITLARQNELVVVSASKFAIPLIDAPATMSVLPADTLATTPAQNFGDLLRSVPGLNVIQLSARDINITSRQATSTLTNSQLTLLDGRSVYLDFFGLVLWDFIPTNPGDIRQIEVIRGPASAVWGANALTGVVNVITKTPREAPGTNVTLTGGWFSRDAGSTRDLGVGAAYGANVTYANAPTDRLSYKFSGGYYHSDPFARPTGQIPLVTDPRDPAQTVGGAPYPADRSGMLGAFQNSSTSQPKFDARIDQETTGGLITYAAGVAGTEGIVHTGIGPFDIQGGSYMGYAKVAFSRGARKLNAFANLVSAEAPNLLLVDPTTARPLQLNFSTQTYDFEAGDAVAIGLRHLLTFGGNARRNNFDITIAPNAENRNEFGGYLQDEIFLGRLRVTAGARIDKFGNIEDPAFSPRLSATFKPAEDHSLRASFNRAFRSPSLINNYLDIRIVTPVDLSALGVAAPFPLVVRAVGSELPIGTALQDALTKESLTAYEIAYNGTLGDRSTIGAAIYVNDSNDNVNFAQLPTNLDPYTSANPPPGWLLPVSVLDSMAALGRFLPRTAFTYLNLGPLRQKGFELSIDHRFTTALSGFANYSWQAKPTVMDDPTPFPAVELALPPTYRVNAGFTFNGTRYLGSGSVNASDRAFWSDVLTSPYHGFTDRYAMVNGSFGMKWAQGRITTLVKVTNLVNEDIQQHVFGDIVKRSGVFEVRFDY
jgi:iron complex outermembrane receptor protein